ncbi:MAG: hypothetical protein RIK87_17390 [Fuerstiella sp.]
MSQSSTHTTPKAEAAAAIRYVESELQQFAKLLDRFFAGQGI